MKYIKLFEDLSEDWYEEIDRATFDMKYIKLFEDINTDGYEEISWDDFYTVNATYKFTLTPFIDSEIVKLTSMGFQLNPNKNDLPNSILKGAGYIASEYLHKLGVPGYNKPVNIFVYRAFDDWYYAHTYKINDIFFKCDQFDSLLNCLKKEFNIY